FYKNLKEFADTPNEGLLQSLGEMYENVSEYSLMDLAAMQGLKGAKALKWATKLQEMAEESPMLAKILNLGTKAIQPIQQGGFSPAQEAYKTGGNPEPPWRAAKTGAFFGMAGEAAPAFAKSGIQKVQEPMTQAAARTASAATIAGEQQSAYEAALERQRQAA